MNITKCDKCGKDIPKLDSDAVRIKVGKDYEVRLYAYYYQGLEESDLCRECLKKILLEQWK